MMCGRFRPDDRHNRYQSTIGLIDVTEACGFAHRASLRLTGLLRNVAGEVVILQANGEKVTIARQQIDEIVPGRTSSVPAGLLDQLTRQEIADLYAYLLPSR